MKKLTVDMEGLCRYVMPSKDDRTTKHVILYGAGKDLHGYMFELEFISRLLEQKGEVEGNFLDRIATCVDTNPRKQGHRASFAGKEYNVTSPESLHELSRPEDTVVIVTSTRYAWEMENVLHQNFADEGFSYCLAPELNCALGGGQVSFQGVQASDEIMGRRI